MNKKDWQRLLARDLYCLHCGEREALSPNHRANRGMGGSRSADVPSNLVVLCSQLNGLVESDHRYADLAIRHGWKVSKWADWRTVPVFDTLTGIHYLLNDDWTRNVFPTERDL